MTIEVNAPAALDQMHSPGEPPAEPDRSDTTQLQAQLQSVLGRRYDVLRPVAIGGMATIFQLRHKQHGGLFAAKLLHRDLAEKAGVVESFQREAKHASLLGGHPNAVPVFDFGEAGGLHYMLMPFIEGEDLDQTLARTGAFSREEALQLAAQVSSMLSHAEQHGITHGDLTPGNLRLDRFGFYRVLDYGISVGRESVPAAFSAATPLYAAPERIRGEQPRLRGDLYALGAILVEVLTGRPAFVAGSLEEIHLRHMQGTWEQPASLAVDDPMRELLRRLLAVDPQQRPASAFELSGILDAFGYVRPEFRRTSTFPGRPRRRLS